MINFGAYFDKHTTMKKHVAEVFRQIGKMCGGFTRGVSVSSIRLAI